MTDLTPDNQPTQETEPQKPPQNPMRWILPLIILIAVIYIFTRNKKQQDYAGSPDGPAVSWYTDYNQSIQIAKNRNKPVLLAFHASWCPPCQQMKKTTYRDPDVIAISEKFVPVMIDSDASPELSQKHNVSGIPAYVILTPDGTTTLASFAGFHYPSDFIEQLKKALPS